jgi:hypothetical protein
MADRSHWSTRKIALAEEGRQNDVAHLTAGERIELVWELTKTAWALKDPHFRESRLRRDVGRVVRGRR